MAWEIGFLLVGDQLWFNILCSTLLLGFWSLENIIIFSNVFTLCAGVKGNSHKITSLQAYDILAFFYQFFTSQF
jgi:hypothetical protein